MIPPPAERSVETRRLGFLLPLQSGDFWLPGPFFATFIARVQSLLLVQCDSTGKNVKQILMAYQSECRRGQPAGREAAREIHCFDTPLPRVRARVFRRDGQIGRGQGEADPGQGARAGIPKRLLVVFSDEMYFI
ncbi:MAG TPA: hypothetical protein VNZ53_10425 [Steroidobacteraceae bacterium]|jgi:hypothetical protein|nr:hypothetical protein [Steroidobacteraceae bacterium]